MAGGLPLATILLLCERVSFWGGGFFLVGVRDHCVDMVVGGRLFSGDLGGGGVGSGF